MNIRNKRRLVCFWEPVITKLRLTNSKSFSIKTKFVQKALCDFFKPDEIQVMVTKESKDINANELDRELSQHKQLRV